MEVSVESLIAKLRIKSGLRSNQLLSDDQLAEILSDAYAELRDKLIARFSYWFKRTLPFTLPTVTGSNKISLSELADDFEMAQGVNLVQGDNRVTVDLLPSFEARNAYSTNAWLLGVGPSWTGVSGLAYFIDGDELEILPRQNATGTFELVYSPMYSRLALPVTYEVAGTPSDFAQDQGGLLGFIFDDAEFTDEMEGGTITVDFDTPNDFLNGTYTIAEVLSPTLLTVTLAWPGTPFTPPAAGSSATVVYQPADTIAALPTALASFQNYLVIAASIEVRNSRDQSVTALTDELARIERRIIGVAKQRTQGVSQAPRMRYGGGYGGWGRGY